MKEKAESGGSLDPVSPHAGDQAVSSPEGSPLLSGWVHGEVDDVPKGREGPSEEGGRHVLAIHIQCVPLSRGPAFREGV